MSDKQFAGVVVKGGFDSTGMPVGWWIDDTDLKPKPERAMSMDDDYRQSAILFLENDGRVLHLGNEVPEWTKERKQAMGWDN